MLIKAGVDISWLNSEIRGVLFEAARVMEEFGDELVVTSTYEGNHREDSYHYGNDAFDFIARYDFKFAVSNELRILLPHYFDVVWEKDHIHVELDRRKFNEQKEK